MCIRGNTKKLFNNACQERYLWQKEGKMRRFMATMSNIPVMVNEVLPKKNDCKSVEAIKYEHRRNYYTNYQIAGSFGGSLRWKTIEIDSNGIATRRKEPVKTICYINLVLPYGSPVIKLDDLKEKLKAYGCTPRQIAGCLLGSQTNGLIEIDSKERVKRIA